MPEFHPYAHLFPMMSTTEHSALVADIKAHGLLHPLTTYQGSIIDGRNRYRACEEAGVEPRYEELPDGVEPLDYVVATNYTRRHLSESQRALASARIMEHSVTREAAGKMFKVRNAGVKQAETVLKNGIPALVGAVENDNIPVNIAAKLASMPEDAQLEACGMKPKELRSVIKKQIRIRKTVSLAKATAKASEKLGTDVYGVIVADPPWRFEPFGPNGMDRAADNHYPTETTESIKAMTVPAADNCVLFLWSTVPMLLDALSVLTAWGFTYKSQFVWVKDRIGTGYWNRNKHEILLVGVKGSIPAPDASDRSDSVIDAPVNEHSEKPIEFLEMVEEWFPTLPKLEMFARRTRPGWASHGNEVEAGAAPEATTDDADTTPYAA